MLLRFISLSEIILSLGLLATVGILLTYAVGTLFIKMNKPGNKHDDLLDDIREDEFSSPKKKFTLFDAFFWFAVITITCYSIGATVSQFL